MKKTIAIAYFRKYQTTLISIVLNAGDDFLSHTSVQSCNGKNEHDIQVQRMGWPEENTKRGIWG